MGTIPVGPVHGGSDWSLPWDAAFRLSKTASELVYAKEAPGLGWIRRARMKRLSMPYVTCAHDLPPEFGNWEGQGLDLRLERLSDPEVHDKAHSVFYAGGALALLKSGRWFGVKAKPSTGMASVDNIEAVPVDEAQLRDMVRLPDDWENIVEVIPP